MEKQKATKKLLREIKAYIIITVGLISYTSGWVIFLLPNNLVGGGVTGISALINYMTGFNVAYSYFIINTVLLIIAFKIMGRQFGAKTIYGIIMSSILLKILPLLIPQTFINEVAIENGRLMCAILGGIMHGVGIGITMGQGGSTGGTDIIALIINKFRAISPGKVIVIIDFFIIASSLLIPDEGTWGHRIATLVYGYVIVGVASYVIDMVVSGSRQSSQIFVFSRKYAEIADEIAAQTHRGVTTIDGMGWFSKQDGKILMVLVRKHEVGDILRIIKDHDETAFVSVGSVMGVYGRGFEQIKK